MPVLSYQPRDPNAVFSNVSWNSTDPPPDDAVTVTAAVPLFPSLVAVMVTEPAATPITNPLPFTVASAGSPVTQVTDRPFKGLPFASLGVAVSCAVSPTVTLADAGLTVTDATGRRPRLCTREEADRLNCALVAVTRKSPGTSAQLSLSASSRVHNRGR